MQVNLKDAVSVSEGLEAGKDIPHLAGIGATMRQVFAAHFMRDCPHVLEIGGHIRPVTPYLTHHPLSVTSADPKAEAYEADELNGRQCHVRHIQAKFQQIDYHYQPGSYGLVMLGYSLKPFGTKDPLGELLFSLIDNAGTVVSRPTLKIRAQFDLHLHDPEIAGTPYAARRFYVLDTRYSVS